MQTSLAVPLKGRHVAQGTVWNGSKSAVLGLSQGFPSASDAAAVLMACQRFCRALRLGEILS